MFSRIEREYRLNDPPKTVNFSKIKVGAKALEDAVLDLGELKRINPLCGDKTRVLEAINNSDYGKMREISNFFYKTSGIYSRLCRYMAYLYRYDWMITPHVAPSQQKSKKSPENNFTEDTKNEKIIENFYKAIHYLDNFEVKKFLGEAALKVIRNGSYYGYTIHLQDRPTVQELPAGYCRSRFKIKNRPVVEMNMRYFKDFFPNEKVRKEILKNFPKEFQKGYQLFIENKLPPTFAGDTPGWYVLDVNSAFKFSLNDEEFPAFISVIPAIIDLDGAQELDRKKMKQKLLKIIIQQMPLDKNGETIFDPDEIAEFHNNAVRMLGGSFGAEVLTTLADVSVADMADKSTTTTVDELTKVERTVYNEAGVSQMQFNTDGNIALEKSILNDEAAMYHLLAQFESFLNDLIKNFNRNKKIQYKVQLLTTTIYNYKEMSKLYKEQTQLGYSKMLPQIALGQSQSSVLANAYFENDILDLVNVFIPPMMSSTMNAEAVNGLKNKNSSSGNSSNKNSTEENKVGRKEKADSEKSEKTIANKESMN